MSDRHAEAARAVFDGSELFPNLPQDVRDVALRHRIAAALRDAEVATWEEAAKHARDDAQAAQFRLFAAAARQGVSRG